MTSPSLPALRARAARRGLRLEWESHYKWRVVRGYERPMRTLYRRGCAEDGFAWERYDPCSHWTCTCVRREVANPDYDGSDPLSLDEIGRYLAGLPVVRTR